MTIEISTSRIEKWDTKKKKKVKVKNSLVKTYPICTSYKARHIKIGCLMKEI
jgi:hypothetical protein